MREALRPVGGRQRRFAPVARPEALGARFGFHRAGRTLRAPARGAGTRVPCRAVVVAQLAPALDAVRLSLHVLAATIWVGGQLTVAGLLPTVRRLGDDAPRRLGSAFARLSWPAYALLLATGIWNVLAVDEGQSTAWQAVLGAKIAVVVLAGAAAWLHGRAKSSKWLGIWGGVAGVSSVAALVMGVLLAG